MQLFTATNKATYTGVVIAAPDQDTAYVLARAYSAFDDAANIVVRPLDTTQAGVVLDYSS